MLLAGWRDDAEKHIEKTCSDNIRRFKLNIFRPRNESSLSELFISFLGKVFSAFTNNLS
jgi:hypothetical protein